MLCSCGFFFFFNDTATTEIYTLSLHDALPIYDDVLLSPHRKGARRRIARRGERGLPQQLPRGLVEGTELRVHRRGDEDRSEEHTSELQSQSNLVCRLLLEKKKKIYIASFNTGT